MPGEPIVLLWSGGKDAAIALDRLLADDQWEVTALLTTFLAEDDRVTMHGVSRSLIARQALLLDLPLYGMHIPDGASNEVYEDRLRTVLAPLDRIGYVACGDVHLEDVRRYREDVLSRLGFRAHFPIWGADPNAIAADFRSRGYRAVVTSVDTSVLDKEAAGRAYDDRFLNGLPRSIDPCGEKGEFHTFVFDGPPFSGPIEFERGEGYAYGKMWIIPLDPKALE